MDLNHRSPVYQTGALTAKPQNLDFDICFGLTFGTFADVLLELLVCLSCFQ